MGGSVVSVGSTFVVVVVTSSIVDVVVVISSVVVVVDIGVVSSVLLFGHSSITFSGNVGPQFKSKQPIMS